MISKLLPIAVLLSLAASSFAQDQVDAPDKKLIESGSMITKSYHGRNRTNENLISVPKVVYPAAAYRTGLEGSVSVDVLISTDGKVLSVLRQQGPGSVCDNATREDVDAIRFAAKTAASGAKFEPAIVDGQRVESTASLSFEFVAPDSVKRELKEQELRGEGTITLGVGEGLQKYRLMSPTPTQAAAGDSNPVMNGFSTFLKKPDYPAAALAVRAAGEVRILVLIETDGTVFWASALSGHPLLRRSSAIAACNSTFKPTLLVDKPVKVSGTIVYNFDR